MPFGAVRFLKYTDQPHEQSPCTQMPVGTLLRNEQPPGPVLQDPGILRLSVAAQHGWMDLVCIRINAMYSRPPRTP